MRNIECEVSLDPAISQGSPSPDSIISNQVRQRIPYNKIAGAGVSVSLLFGSGCAGGALESVQRSNEAKAPKAGPSAGQIPEMGKDYICALENGKPFETVIEGSDGKEYRAIIGSGGTSISFPDGIRPPGFRTTYAERGCIYYEVDQASGSQLKNSDTKQVLAVIRGDIPDYARERNRGGNLLNKSRGSKPPASYGGGRVRF